MTSFRTRRIRERSASRSIKKSKKVVYGFLGFLFRQLNKYRSHIIMILIILVAIGVVFKVTSGVYWAIKEFDPKDIVLSVGKELKRDKNGYVNLVLLGDGGHERDGADLVDTIMVVSLDIDRNRASLISIPRDFYVQDEIYGSSKINEFYRDNKRKLGDIEAYKVFPEVLGRVFNLDIPYYIRVDFKAFVEVVDSLGGVELEVKKRIYDPYYPNETDSGFTVFQIDKGTQILDGERALKFVRSRKTTSDFDRADRQQQILMAIQKKALSKKVLSSPSAIKKLYQSISSNINTNLGIRELIALAKFGKEFDRSQIVNKVLHDDPSREGGFLYTPERKYYNGQFVLLPDGNNLKLIQEYADMILHQPEIFKKPVNLEILNGTRTPGIARELASQLNRLGWNIENLDNFSDETGPRKDLKKTFIQYNKWKVDANRGVVPIHESYLKRLNNYLRADWVASADESSEGAIDISIVLGEDYSWGLE